MPEARILVVDDQEIFADLIQRSLRRAGYTAHVAANGQAGLALYEQMPFDLVLVDVLMPGMNGYAFCAEIRKRSDVPIVLLTSLDSPDELIYGFSQGADDYITKPFQFRELETRIQTILRRTARLRDGNVGLRLQYNEVSLDQQSHELYLPTRRVQLTSIEYRLLHLLISKMGQPVALDELTEEVWGYAFPDIQALVDQTVRQLRAKIEPNPNQPTYLRTAGAQEYFFFAPEWDSSKSRLTTL